MSSTDVPVQQKLISILYSKAFLFISKSKVRTKIKFQKRKRRRSNRIDR